VTLSNRTEILELSTPLLHTAAECMYRNGVDGFEERQRYQRVKHGV
jgi:hypothetical protein